MKNADRAMNEQGKINIDKYVNRFIDMFMYK